jgi:hypothetical protein
VDRIAERSQIRSNLLSVDRIAEHSQFAPCGSALRNIADSWVALEKVLSAAVESRRSLSSHRYVHASCFGNAIVVLPASFLASSWHADTRVPGNLSRICYKQRRSGRRIPVIKVASSFASFRCYGALARRNGQVCPGERSVLGNLDLSPQSRIAERTTAIDPISFPAACDRFC